MKVVVYSYTIIAIIRDIRMHVAAKWLISYVAVAFYATGGGNIISVAFNATVGGNIIFVALIDTCFPVSISSAFKI